MMGTLGIVLKGDDRHLQGKPLMKRTMQIWINAADTLLSMIELPSRRHALMPCGVWRVGRLELCVPGRLAWQLLPSHPTMRHEGNESAYLSSDVWS